MKSHIDESERSGRLVFDGDLTIQRAGELRDTLTHLKDTVDELHLDFSSLEDIDIAVLQVLCSAHRSFIREGKKIIMDDPCSGVLPTIVDSSGFRRSKGCQLSQYQKCLWEGEV